ncbi:MAG TPA: ZPR1 zinc finger domain-containing protein, partial [Candidatus Aenigmarchaeota archaeon]|nr:ZPR1 zinc finger domain-containing protein [Candidatus Aenigmarchaeota archaeon]
QKEPLEFSLKVKKAEDLKIRVVRSSSGTIEIPEFGVKIEPGPQAQGYVTNVEGILLRIEEVLIDQIKVLKGKRKRKAKEVLEKVKKARGGKFNFTLIIKDPLGNSVIVSKKARKRKLEEEEIKNLKVGELILSLNTTH